MRDSHLDIQRGTSEKYGVAFPMSLIGGSP
jgi:hypothetical protein